MTRSQLGSDVPTWTDPGTTSVSLRLSPDRSRPVHPPLSARGHLTRHRGRKASYRWAVSAHGNGCSSDSKTNDSLTFTYRTRRARPAGTSTSRCWSMALAILARTFQWPMALIHSSDAFRALTAIRFTATLVLHMSSMECSRPIETRFLITCSTRFESAAPLPRRSQPRVRRPYIELYVANYSRHGRAYCRGHNQVRQEC